jgi:hypothetical protein
MNDRQQDNEPEKQAAPNESVSCLKVEAKSKDQHSTF